MKVIILGLVKLAKEIYNQTKWDNLSRLKNNIEVTDFDQCKKKFLLYDVILNCTTDTNTYSKDKNDDLFKVWLTMDDRYDFGKNMNEFGNRFYFNQYSL